ncbi:GIN domain-containing protein [Lacibacter sp. H407]|uniref:GIN domain-containing protein n=1 Tax=Lacibacter sp. H407 TaxID=3133423 RepID=UPI0030BC701F
MVQKQIYFYLLVLLGIFVSSCKKDRFTTITKEPDVHNFHKVEIAGEFDIHIVQGADYSVRITGSERDLAELDVQVFDQLLLIEYPDFRMWRKRGTINITMPSLQDMVFAGESTVTVEGFTETVPVLVETSGESKLYLKMNAPVFQLRASSLSEITVSGIAGELKAETAGAATIDAWQTPVIKATAVANSQSTIKLHILQWFTATAAGNSRIYYKGNPAQENLVILGDGQIIKQ